MSSPPPLDKNTAVRLFEVIHRQCVVVESAGATVRQFATPGGDLVVILEERGVRDGTLYQARLRFIGSAAASQTSAEGSPHAAGSAAPQQQRSSRTIFEVEDDLNLTFLTELYRIDEGRQQQQQQNTFADDGGPGNHAASASASASAVRIRCWPFSPDGRCIVQAPPLRSGRGWGLDALPFVHQWLFRLDRPLSEGDAVERTFRRLAHWTREARARARDECARLRALRAEAEAARGRLLTVSSFVATLPTAREAAPHLPQLLALLHEVEVEVLTALRIALIEAAAVTPSMDSDSDDDGGSSAAAHGGPSRILQKRTPSSTTARAGASSSGPSGGGGGGGGGKSFLPKKIRKPMALWRYELHPVPVPVQGYLSMGRLPDSPSKFVDGNVEGAVWRWLQLGSAADNAPPLTDLDRQRLYDEMKEEALAAASRVARDTAAAALHFSSRHSKVAVVRTLHVPVPIPVLTVCIVNPACHRFAPQKSYMSDLASLSGGKGVRTSVGTIPPLWRGWSDFRVQVRGDTGDVVPCGPADDGLEGHGPGGAHLLAEPDFPPQGPQELQPGASTVPRLVRVGVHAVAGVVATPRHLEGLRAWREACLEEPPVVPAPWVEEEVWVPAGCITDTASGVALAWSLRETLAAPTDPKGLLPTAFGLPLADEEGEQGEQGEGEGGEKAAAETEGAAAADAGAPRAAGTPAGKAAGGGDRGATTAAATTAAPSPAKTLDDDGGGGGGKGGGGPSTSGARHGLFHSRYPMEHQVAADREREEKRRAEEAAAAARAAEARKPKYPPRWHFVDEVGTVSSGIWYTQAVARSDPVWFCRPLLTGWRLEKELSARDIPVAMRAREGLHGAVRHHLYGDARKGDGAALLRGFDEAFIVPMMLDKGGGKG
jgi:uncharacterized membrane protein YgcG